MLCHLTRKLAPWLACATLATACAHRSSDPSTAETAASAAPNTVESELAAHAAVRSAVAAPDRSEADRKLDEQRKPEQLLSFFRIAPGQRVAEIGAGGGYTSELLARVVGPKGKVYGQNNRLMLEKFAEAPWAERLQKPELANVVRVDREFDDPLPPEASDLDAVIIMLFYHDTAWLGTDRAAMNKAIFKALKSGGVYGVVDHSAKGGSGINDAKTLHRIEESVLRAEIESAGFRLQEEASFLRNPEDARDWNASPTAAQERRGTSDRFVLRFVKP